MKSLEVQQELRSVAVEKKTSDMGGRIEEGKFPRPYALVSTPFCFCTVSAPLLLRVFSLSFKLHCASCRRTRSQPQIQGGVRVVGECLKSASSAWFSVVKMIPPLPSPPPQMAREKSVRALGEEASAVS